MPQDLQKKTVLNTNTGEKMVSKDYLKCQACFGLSLNTWQAGKSSLCPPTVLQYRSSGTFILSDHTFTKEDKNLAYLFLLIFKIKTKSEQKKKKNSI